MKKTFEFALGIKFIYDDETELLTLTDIGGMTCGHNKLEDDFSCSGLFHAAIDNYRFEGAKWKYTPLKVTEDEFTFKINDKKSYDHLNRCKKQFDKIQYHFMKKTLNKMKIEGIKVQ